MEGANEFFANAQMEEVVMNLINIDVAKCDREEKEVIEGICLSYDMLRGLCLETMKPCDALRDDVEIQ